MTQNKELNLLKDTLEERKAEDIVSFDISASSPFATYALIATAPNPRALGAYADHLEEALLTHDYPVQIKEGEPDSGWIIVQGDEVLVHLLLASNRRMLDLEGLLKEHNRLASKRH